MFYKKKQYYGVINPILKIYRVIGFNRLDNAIRFLSNSLSLYPNDFELESLGKHFGIQYYDFRMK